MSYKRGGKWREERWFDQAGWQKPMQVGSGRLVREVDTGCGPVRVVFDCHGDRGGCFSGEVIGPGKLRAPLRLWRYPHSPTARAVDRREAMHLGDKVINEIRQRCGTRPRKG